MSDTGGLTSVERESFNSLLSRLADLFEAEGRAGGDQAAQALLSAQEQVFHPNSNSVPVDLLRQACALPNALSGTGLIVALSHHFHWTNWEGDGLASEVSARLYTTELVGPDGHVKADDVRVGLLVSAEDTDYPVSSHSGEETYVVLAGVAEWIVGDTGYVAKPTGSFVHHPAWTAHGRRTLGEPFLGAWRWSGDLDLNSFRVET